MDRSTQYPHHLAKLVASRLQQETGRSPAESVLVQLFETLYFASFRTDEGRRILCTVNFADLSDLDMSSPPDAPADRWKLTSFERPLPLEERTLTKLGRAADPDVSSLVVYADEADELYVWGMVDQEPRHGDYITLDAPPPTDRPGLFQATITGTGNIAVHRHGTLLGTLSQNTLVESYYDVLWSGPVHAILASPLRDYLGAHCPELMSGGGPEAARQIEQELLLRWINSISRILVHVQHYRHGGGLLIAPRFSTDSLHIKYRITYGRLIQAVVGLVRAQHERNRAAAFIRDLVDEDAQVRFCENLPWLRATHLETEQRKNEVLGASRFIATLSCVNGVMLLDKLMTVHGFGVELRPDTNLDAVYRAGDTQATPERLRELELTQFGTRHRAMVRYCYQYPGALGFAVSQDGDIQAMTRIGNKLVLWESIDVQLAFKAESSAMANADLPPVLRRLHLRLEA